MSRRYIPERLLRYPQAAAYLGISVGALKLRVYRGQIKPSYRLGRSVWFDPADLIKALTATRQGPSQEA
jgi:hypothetical protein